MNRRDAIKAAVSICCLPVAVPAAAVTVTQSVTFDVFVDRFIRKACDALNLDYGDVIAGPLTLRPKKLRFPVDSQWVVELD